MVMIIILILYAGNLSFGYMGAMTFACIIPIINLVLILIQIAVLVYAIFFTKHRRLFILIFDAVLIFLAILNFIWTFWVNAFGPRF